MSEWVFSVGLYPSFVSSRFVCVMCLGSCVCLCARSCMQLKFSALSLACLLIGAKCIQSNKLKDQTQTRRECGYMMCVMCGGVHATRSF